MTSYYVVATIDAGCVSYFCKLDYKLDSEEAILKLTKDI